MQQLSRPVENHPGYLSAGSGATSGQTLSSHAVVDRWATLAGVVAGLTAWLLAGSLMASQAHLAEHCPGRAKASPDDDGLRCVLIDHSTTKTTKPTTRGLIPVRSLFGHRM